MNEDGGETLYRIRLDEPAVNVGAAVIASSAGSLVHPWFLGSPDENDVQGYAGLPVNVNNLTIDYPLDIGAAGTVFPRTKAYYVAVDSGRDLFTGRSLGGSYVLQAWVDDVQPPLLGLLTEPRLRGSADDRAARARPRLGRRSVLARDRLRPEPDRRRRSTTRRAGSRSSRSRTRRRALKAGKRQVQASAADFQEAKNVDSVGDELLPNTAFASGPVSVVDGPTITWLTPEIRECVPASTPLTVLAGSTAAIRSIKFFNGKKPIATVRRGAAGIYGTTWRARRREGQVHAPRRRHRREGPHSRGPARRPRLLVGSAA